MTLYVPLEEIEKLWRLKHTPELMVVDKEWQYIQLNNIYYIPAIDLSIIDTMIEEINYCLESPDLWENKTYTKDRYYSKLDALEELKKRLSTH